MSEIQIKMEADEIMRSIREMSDFDAEEELKDEEISERINLEDVNI